MFMITYPNFFYLKSEKVSSDSQFKANNFTKYHHIGMKTTSAALGFVSKDLFSKVNSAVFDRYICTVCIYK